jgi:hypothetical protein
MNDIEKVFVMGIMDSFEVMPKVWITAVRNSKSYVVFQIEAPKSLKISVQGKFSGE